MNSRNTKAFRKYLKRRDRNKAIRDAKTGGYSLWRPR